MAFSLVVQKPPTRQRQCITWPGRENGRRTPVSQNAGREEEEKDFLFTFDPSRFYANIEQGSHLSRAQINNNDS